MAVQLSPGIQERITEMVERGAYPDVDTMLEQALDLLADREELSWLQEQVAKGAEQAERGELIAYTPEFREEIRRSALRRGRHAEPRCLPVSAR